MASDFGIDILRTSYSCIETDIINNIKISFNNIISIDQYTVDNYRIDLYFPEYNIALECDEDGHNIPINKILDEYREQYIKNKINCTFIRFKPYDKDFNIFKLINEIFITMNFIIIK